MSTNPIELAVLPLKQDAILRAEQECISIVKKIKDELSLYDNDLERTAPYPKSTGPNAVSTEQYRTMLSKRKFYQQILKSRQCSGRPNMPNYVDVHQPYVDKFIEMAKSDAAFQYDMFVAKLIKKIGTVETATLTGNHVWGFSILTVTLHDNTKQNWKTQQITNVSKLGKLFNQWPSRLIKQ